MKPYYLNSKIAIAGLFLLRSSIDINKSISCILIAINLIALINVAYADTVDEFILARMQEKGIPGLQVAIVQHNKVIKVDSYGIANIQDSIKVNKNTVFNIASMTKAFTCVAVMQLVEQGKLNLSDKISAHIENLPNSWRRVTVHQVLSHSSGLPDIMNKHFQLIDSEGEAQSWKTVQQSKMLFDPGTAFHYNQTNFLIAGQIIQNVSGKSYSNLIKEYQLSKIGMNRTEAAGFAHFEDVNTNQARDYRKNTEGRLTNVLTSFPSSIRAGAGMSSNANELAQWVVALENNAFFEKKSSLSMLFKEASLNNSAWAKNNPNMHPYALGWYVVNRPLNRKIVTAGGGQSALAIYPDDALSIVILTNLAGAAPENMLDELAEFYLDDFGLPKNIKLLKQTLEKEGYRDAIRIAKSIDASQETKFSPVELHHFAELLVKHNRTEQAQSIYNMNNQLFSKVVVSKHVLDQYLGDYKLADFSINVSRKANALLITATDDATLPIFADSENKFTLEQLGVSITFIRDEYGIVTSLTLSLNNQKLIGKKLD